MYLHILKSASRNVHLDLGCWRKEHIQCRVQQIVLVSWLKVLRYSGVPSFDLETQQGPSPILCQAQSTPLQHCQCQCAWCLRQFPWTKLGRSSPKYGCIRANEIRHACTRRVCDHNFDVDICNKMKAEERGNVTVSGRNHWKHNFPNRCWVLADGSDEALLVILLTIWNLCSCIFAPACIA
jgi:hypothetical protein